MAFPNQVNLVSAGTVTESGAGTAWQYPSNTNDGDWDTWADVGAGGHGGANFPPGNAKLLTFTNFNFSWFDNTLYDVTGVSLVVGANGSALSCYFTEVYLVDETGSDIGVNMGASEAWEMYHTAGAFYGLRVQVHEQVLSIPYATYSSANFGVRFLANNKSAYTLVGQMDEVKMILQFSRKKVTSTYGFKLFDSSGADKLSKTSAFVRLVDTVSHVGGYTGSEYVYDFDDTKGVVVVYSHWEKWATGGNTQQTKATAWSTANLGMRGHGMEVPDFTFNNTTKLFTTATGAIYPLPSGWDINGEPSCGWTHNFIHYK